MHVLYLRFMNIYAQRRGVLLAEHIPLGFQHILFAKACNRIKWRRGLTFNARACYYAVALDECGRHVS